MVIILKEELNSFDIYVVTYELDHILHGARIDNVYQINPKILLLKVRNKGLPQIQLLIEAGKRIHSTSHIFEKPLKPPIFSIALRKYLRNGEITEIRQHEFERIVIIEVKKGGEEYRLVCELFREGNIILVGPDGKILQALTYRRMKDRNVLRGESFQYPPSIGCNPKTLNREVFNEIKAFGETDIVRALTKLLSIGGLYAEEILIRAGVEKNTPCKSLREDDLNRIFDRLQNLLLEIAPEGVKPYVFVDEQGNWIDVSPTRLEIYAHLKPERFGSLNEALDEYYAKAYLGKKVSDTARPIERELGRLRRILKEQEEALENLKRMAELNRGIGDIIYRHMNEIQTLLQWIMGEKRSGKSWSEIDEALQKGKQAMRVPAVYFHLLKPEEVALQISIEDQTFQLDLRLSAKENAADYYEKAKKAQRKISGADKALLQTQSRIKELESRMAEQMREAPGELPRIPKKRWYEKFRWFYSSAGFLVIAGRDASTNEIIIKKHMEPNDIVFHADIPGAPFVIVKTEGKAPLSLPEQTLKEAAQFAASYSRAWREMLAAIDVYWISPEQVSKRPPSGQYLSRGAFMIYGTRNYVRNLSLEVAIGVKKEEDKFKVIGGPSNAITKQTNIFVRLIPGRERSGKLAKQIRDKLARMASNADRKKILKTPLEEIQRFIPSGGGSLI